MVLVKNDGLLPLSSDVTNLNVFGWVPPAQSMAEPVLPGSHSDGNVSILQSLQDAGYKQMKHFPICTQNTVQSVRPFPCPLRTGHCRSQT